VICLGHDTTYLYLVYLTLTNFASARLGFGGKYVCRWLKEGKLDVGYTAHPSFVDKEELEGIKGPLSIAAAGELFFTGPSVPSRIWKDYSKRG
jgi:hypothetical protein